MALDRSLIAVSVLTGFLGAGKTTLLNRLLKDPALADTAVIINEFGDVAIDHLLVEQSSDGIIQLSDGCLCCTVRGELVDTLTDLIEQVQSGRIERLKRIIIETTGLADPAPVLQSIIAHPVLAQALRLDGVITVVDAINGEATLDAHVEAVKQAAMADRILIAKVDLAGDTTVLRARLRHLNPGARILDVSDSESGHAALFECGLYDSTTKTSDVQRWLGEAHHHHHGHEEGDHHDHDHHGGHDSRIQSLSLVHGGAVPYASIEMFVEILLSTHGDKLLRLKGIVELVEDPDRPLVIHGVQKTFHPPAQLSAWPDSQRGTRMVLIMMDMPHDYVRRLFAAFTNQPAIDTPDRAALESNPLAVAGFRG